MNRGVMVTRGDPSKNELEFSAEGICSNEDDDPVKARLKHFFKPLSEAYTEICKAQDREFFGLRDFYRYPANYGCMWYDIAFLFSFQFDQNVVLDV